MDGERVTFEPLPATPFAPKFISAHTTAIPPRGPLNPSLIKKREEQGGVLNCIRPHSEARSVPSVVATKHKYLWATNFRYDLIPRVFTYIYASL